MKIKKIFKKKRDGSSLLLVASPVVNVQQYFPLFLIENVKDHREEQESAPKCQLQRAYLESSTLTIVVGDFPVVNVSR